MMPRMDEPIVTGVEVPWNRLSADALRGLAHEFVTRDGTDYGPVERSVDEKIAAVLRQLERGEAIIVCDPDGESFNIVPARR